MFSSGVVEPVDVLKEGVGNVLSGCPSVPPDQFGFEGFEEGLNGGIVVTVSFAAHGYFEAYFTHPFLIVMGTILTATVCMMDAAWWRVARCHCIVQGLQRQITFQAIADGPADNAA